MATMFVTFVMLCLSVYFIISMHNCCLCGRKVLPVRKFGKILLISFVICLFFAVSAFAAEDTAEAAATFDVNIVVNGDEYVTVPVGASVEGNVYTFEIGELLDAIGLKLTYSEESGVAVLAAEHDTLAAVLFCELEPSGEPSDEASAEPSGEPSDEASAEPSGEPSDEASAEPSDEALAEPSGEPSDEASSEPSGEPLDEASAEPSEEASGEASAPEGEGVSVETARHVRVLRISQMVKRRDVVTYIQ